MDIFFIRPLYALRFSKRFQVFCAIRANGRLADLGRADQLVSHVNSRWFPPRCPRRCHRLGRCTRTTTSAWPMCSPWSQSCLADKLKYHKISDSSDFTVFYIDQEVYSGYLWHLLFHVCMRFVCSSTSFLQVPPIEWDSCVSTGACWLVFSDSGWATPVANLGCSTGGLLQWCLYGTAQQWKSHHVDKAE